MEFFDRLKTFLSGFGSQEERDTLSREDALMIAAAHGVYSGVLTAMNHGYSPVDALEDWDILPVRRPVHSPADYDMGFPRRQRERMEALQRGELRKPKWNPKGQEGEEGSES